MRVMAKPKRVDPDEEPPPGGRAAVKYVALPLDLWNELLRIAEENERSISWVARRAVRLYLEGLKKSGDDY